ncbi:MULTISPECIES: CheR family methyltransferase [Falsihalocynthiibacter]|uniref:CheR family methyltransferase n=1 Tax=Falsihalocynthiibacter TaxID=2854182 RepID=UPI0030039A00
MNALNPSAADDVGGMTPDQFAIISSLAHKEAGLVFPVSKSALVSSRLVKRLRETNIVNFDDYCQFVSSPDGKNELRLMISALTTNISSFFRENHHFEYLKTDVFPDLARRAKAGNRIRIWSAGCSVGMEAYSIGMTLLEILPQASSLDVKILASDIDPKVLIVGKNGTFDERQLSAIPQELRKKYFDNPSSTELGKFQAHPDLLSLTTFRELNLLEKWPISGSFDIIFCRNTVIYFDDKTQNKLWPRFQNALAPEGWLFVGHSERVPETSNTDFENRGMTIYRRSPRPTT